MNDFNKLVLNIAVIILIVVLTVVGITLFYSIRDAQFPPYITDCPTFYEVSGNNCIFEGNNPYSNPINYLKANNPTKSSCLIKPISEFRISGTDPMDVLCEKNKWAQSCNIYWDGVTNNESACINSKNNLFLN